MLLLKFFTSTETNVVFVLIFCGGEDCSAFIFLPGSLHESSSLVLVSFSLYLFFYLAHCKHPAPWYWSASPFTLLPGSLQAAARLARESSNFLVLASFYLYSSTWIIASSQLPGPRQLLPFILLPGSLQAASSLVLASFSFYSSTWIITSSQLPGTGTG